MLSVPTKKSQTFFFLESVCANDERFLSAQAWTPVTAERHWVPGSGRPGVGEVAGSTTRLATRQQPEGPSRPPDPPTSRGLAGTRHSPQWPRTQRRGQAAGQNSITRFHSPFRPGNHTPETFLLLLWLCVSLFLYKGETKQFHSYQKGYQENLPVCIARPGE